MLKIIALSAAGILLLAIAVIVILAAARPDEFRVARSATMTAPVAAITPYLTDFRQYRRWSPYETIDPEMQRAYSGASSGVGAAYAWRSEGKVGAGSMQITAVDIADGVSASAIRLKLDFVKPFEAHNRVTYTLLPKGDVTEVTWTMEGRTPFLGKIMHVVFDMDGMVGKDFAAGLANLKGLVEGKR